MQIIFTAKISRSTVGNQKRFPAEGVCLLAYFSLCKNCQWKLAHKLHARIQLHVKSVRLHTSSCVVHLSPHFKDHECTHLSAWESGHCPPWSQTQQHPGLPLPWTRPHLLQWERGRGTNMYLVLSIRASQLWCATEANRYGHLCQPSSPQSQGQYRDKTICSRVSYLWHSCKPHWKGIQCVMALVC